MAAAMQMALEDETGAVIAVQSVDALVRTTPLEGSGQRSIASSDAHEVADDSVPVGVTLILICGGVILLGLVAGKLVYNGRLSAGDPKMDEIETLGRTSKDSLQGTVPKLPNDGAEYLHEPPEEQKKLVDAL